MKYFFLFSTFYICVIKCYDVFINIDTPATIIDENFLSVTLDWGFFKQNYDHNIHSPKLLALAKGLSKNSLRPEFYLRFGGSNADHAEFDPNMILFNKTQFDDLCQFAHKLMWKLIFDLNSLQRNKDGSWDPSNAIELIEYVTKQGYYIHYELGNEPDLYPTHLNITIPPQQLANDFKTFRNILDILTRKQSMLIGPDMATLTRYNYFENFLKSLKKNVLNAISFHHYYSSSENITTANFTDIKYLDEFMNYTQQAWTMIKNSVTFFPIPSVWIGETSSTYGGGGNVGESFAAGFLWLDKLGLAAQLNISVVFRQSLKGAKYSLINSNLDPNPDYWITLLHKHLVGRIVLNVTGFLEHNRETRIYAHCVNRFGGLGYEPNEVVLIILNMNKQNATKITFKQYKFQELLIDQYLFSPANGKLEDKVVSLNGNVLKMINDTTLPEIKSIRIAQPIVVPPLQYGFYVLVGSNLEACTK